MLIEKAARDLAAARNVVALTGAGISIGSGIPPFRGKGGLWEKFDPMQYASIDAFMADPEKVWREFIGELKVVIDNAQPNAAHMALARLERLGMLHTVITQNVDGLHQAAGNTTVIEFHGTFTRQRCTDCAALSATRDVDLSRLPPRCWCGGVLRPDWVFFGEMIPSVELDRARQSAAGCDLMLVIGTSALVQPAAYLPVIAREASARVIEINAEATPLTASVSDYLIQGKAEAMLDQILGALEALRPDGPPHPG